jgi:hypothetical protein
MKYVRSLILHLLLIAAFGTPVLAQDAPPKEAFKTVHLVNLRSPADVAALQAAIADMNKVVANAGHPDVRYRLYKVIGKQAGPYGYLWESSWPGGEAYDRVHKHPEWIASSKKHPELDVLMKDEVYNRYVEVPAAKK